MAKEKNNFLDLIPRRVDSINWNVLENGNVQIIIDRNGFLDRLVRFFAKTPEIMKIDLDQYGSAVWKSIDGERTTYEICEILKDEFGSNIEPLYERFGTYLNVLKNNRFIEV